MHLIYKTIYPYSTICPLQQPAMKSTEIFFLLMMAAVIPQMTEKSIAMHIFHTCHIY